jgi:hypothetical protein
MGGEEVVGVTPDLTLSAPGGADGDGVRLPVPEPPGTGLAFCKIQIS